MTRFFKGGWLRTLPSISVAALSVACSGAVGSTGGGDRDATEPGERPAPPALPDVSPEVARLEMAPARVRRLTAHEINNAAADVFCNGEPIVQGLTDSKNKFTYSTSSEGLGVSLGFTEGLQSFAERVATQAIANLPKLLPCQPSQGDATCAEAFVKSVGLRAYRRPLTADERESFTKLYRDVAAFAGHGKAIGAMIEAMVQSPHFLFRTELGDSVGKAARLTDFETASALAFFLWRSAPDDELLSTAAAGGLAGEAEIARQVERMLKQPRALTAAREFVLEWLGLHVVDGVTKDSGLFPQWQAIRPSAAAEAAAFVDQAVKRPDFLSSLLTEPTAFVDGQLAGLYGLQQPAGSGLQRITTDGSKRGGVFTLPAFAAVHTGVAHFSPVHIGKFIQTRLLCQPPAPPPPDAESALPPNEESVSTRQRFAKHSTLPHCAGCHKVMDPVGFGFEQYTPIGKHETMEKGRFALTGEGRLEGSDVDGAFTGPIELGKRLAKSEQVASCLAEQLVEYALGRKVDGKALASIDSAALKRLNNAATDVDGLMGLMREVALTEAFRIRDTTSLSEGGR